MLESNLELIDNDTLSSTAFIFYIPSSSKKSEKIFYNQDALQILSLMKPAIIKEKLDPRFLSSLCSNWAKLIQNSQISKNIEKKDFESKPFYLDTITSYRRRYVVKGAILWSYDGQRTDRSYVFILQRFVPEDINLLKIFRKYQLSHREQEIIRLLLHGESNKQIAYSLGLSSNTIKSYMKLLMRKMGISSRAGIMGVILTDT
jgi:DNA-binding CsgD family transcriptional regulator